MSTLVPFGIILFVVIIALSLVLDFDPKPEILLVKSAPHIGVDRIHSQGYTGKGVTVAVIDTGIDFSHPDIHESNGTGIGYNFVNESEPPNDTNGHGTQVAGIIAANGDIRGIAPDAKILAYKVSNDGEAVASDLIVRAIQKATKDGADIINISLGVNKTNSRIDSAVNEAVKNGILVIVAAGNNGPLQGTIGSPGRNPNAITVGATHNNVTASLVSTLEINGTQYQAIPMLGTDTIRDPIRGKVIFGGYGRNSDLKDVGIGSIVLVERGSDTDEIIYFAEKEFNAANAGAGAIIVYNNEPGLYLGDVSKSLTIKDYTPRIPIVSLSREDGLKIKTMHRVDGVLDVFYNPDHVAFFSSRGPASPFYIKPDLVAPGALINTTHIDATHNLASGTSFAAPHVTGSAALLLEKYPGLKPDQLRSLLTTTTVPVTDAYGNGFAIADAGAGRLNLENAFGAKLIIQPTSLIMTFSPAEKKQTALLHTSNIGDIDDIIIHIESPEFIKTKSIVNKSTIQIKATNTGSEFEDFDGTTSIRHNGTEYRIPLILRYTQGSVTVQETKGLLSFEVIEPKDWRYAKISVINSETGEFFTTSVTPRHDSTVAVPEPGKYWIESRINSGGQVIYAYDTVLVKHVHAWMYVSDIPEQVYTAIIITGTIVIVGIVLRRTV